MVGSISIQQVYEELKKIEKRMVTKKEIESLIDTISIMNNPETLKQIAGSIEDIKHGRVKETGSSQDLLNEL